MARIPYPDIENAPPKVRDFFEKIKANSPRILNVNRMMAHSPGSVRELIIEQRQVWQLGLKALQSLCDATGAKDVKTLLGVAQV